MASVVVLGIVAPTLSVIAAAPTFLSAHDTSAGALAGITVLLIASTWGFLAILALLLKRATSQPTFDLVISAVTFAVTAFLAGNVLASKLANGFASALLAAGAAAVIATLATMASRRLRIGRAMLVGASLAAVAPLAIQGAAASEVSYPLKAEAIAPVDVIWVVADELQAGLVMEADGKVRPQFANLRGLQEVSTTYSDAYSTAFVTEVAMPSMLAGIADAASVPAAVLDRERDRGGVLSGLATIMPLLFVSPMLPDPCREQACASGSSMGASAETLVADLLVLAGKVALADPLARLLPSTEGRWSGFFADSPDLGNVQQVLDGLDDGDSESPGAGRAVFWHTMMTHGPWSVGDDGKPIVSRRFNVLPDAYEIGRDRDGRIHSPELEDLQWRLYSSAAREFDRQLGGLLTHLKETNRFRDALIVVTADHGVDPDAPASLRRTSDGVQGRWANVARVPLLVKYPGQSEPAIVAEPRSVAQIPATVLDALHAEPQDRTLAPPLSSPLAPITFSIGTGDARYPESRPDVVTRHPWLDGEESGAVDTFAVGIESDDVGRVPGLGWSVVNARTHAYEGESEQVLRIVFVEAGTCHGPVGLLTSAGRTVGSVLWEQSTGPGEVRGWSIAPIPSDQSTEVWCQ